MLRAAALSLAAVSAAAAPLTGTLYQLYADPDNPLAQLSLVTIDPNTADNATIASVSLGDITTTFPAKSCYDESLKRMIVAVASSPGIFEVSLGSGKATLLAPLNNESDPYLGVVAASEGVFVITQNALYSVANGEATQVADLSGAGLPSAGQVTLDASSSTLFVGNPDKSVIYKLDLSSGSSYKVTSIKVRRGYSE